MTKSRVSSDVPDAVEPGTQPKDTAARSSQAQARPSRAARVALIAFCVLVAVAAVGSTWLQARPAGDLYVAVAGGQDALTGQLGEPDNWAFTTRGRVWINQNWLSGLLFYAVYMPFGLTGIAVLKGAILATTVAMAAMAARRRGSGWPLAILVSGAMLLAAHSYLDTRPNVIAIMLAGTMMAILYHCPRRPHLAWAALALAVLWSNMHGSFIFGIGMMGLMATCIGAAGLVRRRLAATIRTHWPIFAATPLAIVLAAALSPFGVTNLTHPFVVASVEQWRRVTEWRPIWDTEGGGDFTVWEFLLVLGIVITLPLIRVMLSKPGKSEPAPKRDYLLGSFEVILVIITVAMACQSRRFIPLSLVIMTPLAARVLESFLESSTRVVPTAVLGAVLLAPALFWGYKISWHYRGDSPLYQRETFGERMTCYHSQFPVGVVQFMNANGISGRVYNNWRWEGYLRWHCPQLKLFAGGRAQQIYDVDTFSQYLAMLDPGSSVMLKRHGIHLVIVPAQEAGLMPPELIYGVDVKQNAPIQGFTRYWAYIYHDGANMVMADYGDPATRQLIEKAAAGSLKYPDESTRILSQAMCLASPVLRTAPDQSLAALEEAIAAKPCPDLFIALKSAIRSQAAAQQVVAYLNMRRDILIRQPLEQMNFNSLAALGGIDQTLWEMQGGSTPATVQYEKEMLAIKDRLENLRKRWK